MPAPDPADAPLVTADGWGYRHPGRAQWAVRDATFQLAPGSLTVLLGASGSGKSTLLAGMAGLLGSGDTSGALNGPSVIGYVGQEPESNIVMERVGDDVAFPLENRAVPAQEIWDRAHRVLGEVGLAGLELRDTATLSGGQTQLLSLAAALAPGPQLLLLDEPTANLDPDAALRVVNAVLAARERTGCAVVVIEHRVAAWLDQADLVLLMVDGKLTGLAPAQLADAVAESSDLAEHVWLGSPTRPARRPSQPPGAVVLSAVGVAVADRLVAPDLTVRAGEVVALVGPPGSGKTTLLHVVAGLLRPRAGTVSLMTAQGALDQPWHWRAQQVSEHFGIVFQDPVQQFLTGSVSAELGHGLAVAGVPPHEAAHRVARMVDNLGLAGLGPVNPFTLSGGQARRLSVGTALIAAPSVLVLDEPTFGQDPGSWAAMAGIIADHRDGGGSVLLATHDPHLVAWLGAREVRLGDTSSSRAAGQHQPRAGLLRRLNPLALLAGAGILSAAALASRSVGTNLLLAATGIVLALVGGAPRRRLTALLAPAILAGASAALSNAMLAPGGMTQAGNWQAAMLPATRIIAVAVPGLVAAVSIDPTALADSLTQLLRVPARPAYAVLAGLRLLPLLGAQWEILRRASRARGIAGDGLLGRAKEFVSVSFRMLVTALRRGTQLALALDARGLGAGPRTVARPQRFTFLDGLCLVACAGIVWGAWLA